MRQAVTIVGGGLAGLTLGIRLRRHDVPVTIWEAGRYPRHRVCGEFISGRGLHALGELGLIGEIEQAGARWARTAACFVDGRCCGVRVLPLPALCVSRYVLDALLARTFQNEGGSLWCERRWMESTQKAGVVHAGGRPPPSSRRGGHWYGLKAHVRGVELAADLEMHVDDRGYIGLCRLGDGRVNVCGLFRRRGTEPPPARDFRARFIERTRHELRRRLMGAIWDESSRCVVAALPFQTTMRHADECRIGDALAVMPPFTGNGMSFAFESATMAVELLLAFSNGEQDWAMVCAGMTSASQRHFARRLRCSRWLHAALFRPGIRLMLSLGLRAESVWSWLFELTR